MVRAAAGRLIVTTICVALGLVGATALAAAASAAPADTATVGSAAHAAGAATVAEAATAADTVILASADTSAAPATVTDAKANDGAPSGLEIAKKSDHARRAASEYSVMTMTLENSRHQQRVRTIEGWSREVTDDEEQRFSRFLEPADVKDTTLLYYDYDEKDDDTWLYLPALKKVKRILSSNKKDYFMGSDFTYEDMENIDLVNRTYTITGSGEQGGVDCYLLEAVPNNPAEEKESAYSKTVSWIAKTDMLPRRIEYYDKKGKLSKVLTFSEIRPTSSTDPRPRAHRLVMENLASKHTTILTYDQLRLDVAVNDDIFSQRNLRR